MKERHPIDDLFRKGLYDSEATPPADVWQRVVAQRSWGHRLLMGLQRRWAMGLVGAALLVAPLAWYAASPQQAVEVGQAHPGATEIAGVSGSEVTLNKDANGGGQVVAAPVEAGTANEVVVPVTSDQTTSTASVQHTTVATDERPKSRAVGVRSGAEGATRNEQSRGSAKEHDAASGTGPALASSSEDPAAGSTHGRSTPGSASVEENSIVTGTPAVVLAAQPANEEDYVSADMVMLRTRLTKMDRTLDSLKMATKPTEAPYVLPHGAWWFGVQFGVNDRNGGWRGEGRLAEELNAAETWQSGWHAGAVGGRTWRSGLSVSAGIEYASVKSRFLFSEERITESDSGVAMVLDTTWSVNAVAPDSSYVVYTYDIAFVPLAGYEGDVRYNATNRYTLLSLPVEIAFQKNSGRWTFAPRVGAAFNWFIGRDGRTLLPSTGDGGPRTVPLSSASVSDRFGLWITGSAGLDAGYALNERLQVFAGGGYSTLLSGGNDLRPEFGGAQFRVRLVHEFGLKQRKAKLP